MFQFIFLSILNVIKTILLGNNFSPDAYNRIVVPRHIRNNKHVVILRALSQELVILKSTLTVYKVFRAIALCANFPTYPDHPHYVFSFLLPKPTCKRDCYILSAPSRFTRTSEPDRALPSAGGRQRGQAREAPDKVNSFPAKRQSASDCDNL